MNNYKFHIISNQFGYFFKIIIDSSWYVLYNDIQIANFLGISVEKYQRIFLDKFKCEKLRGEIYFNSEDSILNAIDWLKDNMDQFLVAKILIQ